MTSRYDELHDQFYKLLSSKAGTRYERLAAVVFAHLGQSSAVIHDLKLHGDSGVLHQIDVVIERQGRLKRILIECKDFDQSKEKVGLGIVRDFFGVIHDVHPDEAYIVTCTGFTHDAEQFARSKGIRLAILRAAKAVDLENITEEIVLSLDIVSSSQPRVHWRLDGEDQRKFDADLQALGFQPGRIGQHMPVYVNAPDGRFQFNDFVRRSCKFTVHDKPGRRVNDVDATQLTLEVDNRGRINIRRLVISFDILVTQREISIRGKQLAQLILQGVDVEDVVIWDNDLRQFVIDNKGNVARLPDVEDAVTKRRQEISIEAEK